MQQEPTSRFITFFIDASILAAIISLVPLELQPWYGVICRSSRWDSRH